MLNLSFPANAQFFAFSILRIVNVDILDPDLINPILGLNFERDEEMISVWEQVMSINPLYSNYLTPSIQEMGFETFNPILNLGGLFFIFLMYLFQVLWLLFLNISVGSLKRVR